MAFTGLQKAKIREYLGYPNVFKDANPRLEDAINLVGNDADESTLAVAYLADIDAAMASYLKALKSAGLRTLDKDDVGFFENNGVIKGNAQVGRAFCSRLSILFGVPIANDIFSGGGYQSDGWMYPNGQVLAGLG